MHISVLSDTHDNLPAIRQAVALFNREAVEVVIHCGDIVAPFAAKELLPLQARLIIVYGNNDGEKAGLRKILPQIAEPPRHERLGEKNAIIAHDIESARRHRYEGVDLVVYGHSHISDVRRDGAILYVNPGECGGWLTGRRSVAILDTETMKCDLVDLE
jgi:putative phosphoesterase